MYSEGCTCTPHCILRSSPVSQVIGAISGDGRVVVTDTRAPPGSPAPVDLDLEHVLGDMPNKTFEFQRLSVSSKQLELPADELPLVALEKVLRLPAVGSKRFLTTKVDRCVTGEACSCKVCAKMGGDGIHCMDVICGHCTHRCWTRRV